MYYQIDFCIEEGTDGQWFYAEPPVLRCWNEEKAISKSS